MVKLSIEIPGTLYRALRYIAEQNNTSLDQVVEEALLEKFSLRSDSQASRDSMSEAHASLPYLRVTERYSNRELGHLGDVSREGVMLIANQPFDLEKTYHITAHLPHAPNQTERVVHMQVEPRWCKPDAENPRLYSVGCQFLSIQPSDHELLIHHSSRLDLTPTTSGDRGRTNLVFYLEVLDAPGEELLGHVGDISANGIMLITRYLLPLGQTRDLRIRLPELEEFESRFIDVRIETRWSKPDVNPELHCIGCLFVKISPRNRELVRQVQNLLELG